jgi:hypothetical protein
VKAISSLNFPFRLANLKAKSAGEIDETENPRGLWPFTRPTRRDHVRSEMTMRRLLATVTAAAALAGGGAVATSAQADPNLVQDPNFQQAAVGVYLWGGHNYCWYNGWRGPGWYWCGYGARRGFGWGGGYGWHGWVGPAWGWRRGYAYPGYGYGWHRGWYGHGWHRGWDRDDWHRGWHGGGRHWR